MSGNKTNFLAAKGFLLSCLVALDHCRLLGR